MRSATHSGLARAATILAPPTPSHPLWGVWMASEHLPSLVAAYRLGLFEVLAAGPRALSDLAGASDLSARAATVLAHELVALRLLEFDRETNCFRLSHAASTHLLRPSEGGVWHRRIIEMTLQDITPGRYLAFLERDVPLRYRYALARPDEAPLCRIAADRFRLPILIAADRTGLLRELQERPGSDAATVAVRRALPIEYVHEMLAVLVESGVVARLQSGWVLTPAGATYGLTGPVQPYHWGGIFGLMSANPARPLSLFEAIGKERDILRGTREAQMMEHVLSPELARVFADHMHSQGAAAAVAVAQHPLLAETERFLDVAGGGGTYSAELAATHPHIQATILEVHPMDDIARERIALRDLAARVRVERGDMFEVDWPAGHDTIFLSHILHDWGPEKNERLLRRAFQALPPGGRLIIHELLLGGPHHDLAAAFSVTLYKWTEGRQYTAVELQTLLRRAGFEASHDDVFHLPGHPTSLVLARKPR